MKYFITPVLLVFFIISYIFGVRKKHFNFAFKELDYTQSFHNFVFSFNTRGKLIQELINKQEVKIIGYKEEKSTAKVTQKEKDRVLRKVHQFYELYHCSVIVSVMLAWITCFTILGAIGDFIFKIADFESVLFFTLILIGITCFISMIFVLAIQQSFTDENVNYNNKYTEQTFSEIENNLAKSLQDEWSNEQWEKLKKTETIKQRKLEKEKELLSDAEKTKKEYTEKSREVDSLVNKIQSTIAE